MPPRLARSDARDAEPIPDFRLDTRLCRYDGERRAGAVRPGPIYARIWIDQELKRELDF